MGSSGRVLKSRRSLERYGRYLCQACACYTETPIYCGCDFRGGFREVHLGRPQRLGLYLHSLCGASTRDLAATLRVSPATASSWLTGALPVALARFWVIACLLDTTVVILLEELDGWVSPALPRRRKGS